MKKILDHLEENWIRHGFETLVVTVGILGAFALNNWNEGRKDRILEKNYLANVNSEFKDNKKQFERILHNFNTQLAYADSIMDLLPITKENWDHLNGYYLGAFNLGSFDPSNSSIDVLINSGRIDLVQNDSIKKLLLSWTDQFQDYKEEEELLDATRDKFLDIYINETSYPNFRSGEVVYLLSEDLRIKLEKLVGIRQVYLQIVLGEIPDGTESDQLMKSIDAIISLTESYNK